MDRRHIAVVWAGALLSAATGCTLDPMLSDRLGDGGEPSNGDAGGELPAPTASVTDVLPAPHGLLTVFGTGPKDVWVAGDEGTLARFDGRNWRSFSTPVISPLRGSARHWPGRCVGRRPAHRAALRRPQWVEVVRDPRETLLDIWVNPRGEAWIAGHANV